MGDQDVALIARPGVPMFRLTPAQVCRIQHKENRATRHGEHVHEPGKRCEGCRPAPKEPVHGFVDELHRWRGK